MGKGKTQKKKKPKKNVQHGWLFARAKRLAELEIYQLVSNEQHRQKRLEWLNALFEWFVG